MQIIGQRMRVAGSVLNMVILTKIKVFEDVAANSMGRKTLNKMFNQTPSNRVARLATSRLVKKTLCKNPLKKLRRLVRKNVCTIVKKEETRKVIQAVQKSLFKTSQRARRRTKNLIKRPNVLVVLISTIIPTEKRVGLLPKICHQG